MNIKTDDNNIAALLDTRDGVAYRKQFTDALGHIEQTVIDRVNTKIADAWSDRPDMQLGTEMHEALAVLSSFLAVGKKEDENDANTSQERLRMSAMFVALSVYMLSVDARDMRIAFNEVSTELGMPDFIKKRAYIDYLTAQGPIIVDKMQMVLRIQNAMASIITDVVVLEGLKHGV